VVSKIEPNVLNYTHRSQTIRLRGAHFVNGVHFQLGFRGLDVDWQSPELVDVHVPGDVPPGTYTLTLSDDLKQLAAYKDAVKIQAADGLLPVLDKVEPAVIDYGPDQRVDLRGKRFPNNMRVTVGYVAVNTHVDNAENAWIQVPQLAASAYDIALADEQGNELARVPKALKIQLPVTEEVILRVRYTVPPDVVKSLSDAVTPNDRRSSAAGPVLLSVVPGDVVEGTTMQDRLTGPQQIVVVDARVTVVKKGDALLFEGKPVKQNAPITLNPQNAQALLSNGDIVSVRPVK
jgi:hypothetical protein